jgi:hypothetical protein
MEGTLRIGDTTALISKRSEGPTNEVAFLELRELKAKCGKPGGMRKAESNWLTEYYEASPLKQIASSMHLAGAKPPP